MQLRAVAAQIRAEKENDRREAPQALVAAASCGACGAAAHHAASEARARELFQSVTLANALHRWRRRGLQRWRHDLMAARAAAAPLAEPKRRMWRRWLGHHAVKTAAARLDKRARLMARAHRARGVRRCLVRWRERAAALRAAPPRCASAMRRRRRRAASTWRAASGGNAAA